MSSPLRKRADQYAERYALQQFTPEGTRLARAEAWLDGYEAHQRMVSETFRKVAGKFYTASEIALIKRGKIREANSARRSRLKRSRGNIT